MNADNTDFVIAHTSSGAEALARKVRRAHVVSAFGTVPSEVLFSVYERRRKAARPSLVYCGDDQSAKEIAATLIRDVGFDPIDAGRRALPGSWSRSRCSSGSSHTRAREARSSPTASNGSGSND